MEDISQSKSIRNNVIGLAKALTSDFTNKEYIRGQAELISDIFNMGGEFHVENSVRVLHEMGASADELESIYGQEGVSFLRSYTLY